MTDEPNKLNKFFELPKAEATDIVHSQLTRYKRTLKLYKNSSI